MRSGAAGESDDGIRLDPWRALAAEVGRRSKGRALISTVPTILPRLAKNGGRRRELQPVTASSPQTEVCSDDAFSARLFSGRRAYTQSALATGRLEAEASERLGRANVSICSAPSTPKRVRFRLSEERTKFFKSVATADRMPSVGRSCAPQTAKKEAHSPRGRHLIRSTGRRGSLKSASLGRSSGFKSASAARGPCGGTPSSGSVSEFGRAHPLFRSRRHAKQTKPSDALIGRDRRTGRIQRKQIQNETCDNARTAQ